MYAIRSYYVKLIATLLIALAVFLAFAQGDYRVTANAVIEGEIQRVLATPSYNFV